MHWSWRLYLHPSPVRIITTISVGFYCTRIKSYKTILKLCGVYLYRSIGDEPTRYIIYHNIVPVVMDTYIYIFIYTCCRDGYTPVGVCGETQSLVFPRGDDGVLKVGAIIRTRSHSSINRIIVTAWIIIL